MLKHLIISAVLLLAAEARAEPLVVSADFPGGSGTVESIDQGKRIVRLRPASHPQRGWECWWYVRIDGLTPGETITLDVGEAPWATPDRAAVSDDGINWRQTGPGRRNGKRIVYRHDVKGEGAYFAWGPPLIPSDAEALVRWAAEKIPRAEAFELCRTREDRAVPALRLAAAGEGETRHGIWIQARQHAWEAGSSWVCRGFVEWLVSDDPRAESLRRRANVTIVPIMDIDSAAIGAGGKSQIPQDHNRDWSDEPHWPSVAAAMKEIGRQNADDAFDLFVDLHNPGADSTAPFFFVTPRKLLGELGRRNLDRFLAAAREDMTGPLGFAGQVRESGPEYDRQWQRISKNWVSFHTKEHVVAVTLETAWNTPHSTADGYREVGRGLGLAIERYLRTQPRLAEAAE